jgi:hypothetical protein
MEQTKLGMQTQFNIRRKVKDTAGYGSFGKIGNKGEAGAETTSCRTPATTRLLFMPSST